MPTPRKGETQQDYVSRAIKQLREEGKPQKQSIAIAYSMYEQHQKTRGADPRKKTGG